MNLVLLGNMHASHQCLLTEGERQGGVQVSLCGIASCCVVRLKQRMLGLNMRSRSMLQLAVQSTLTRHCHSFA